jgi:hypothetical protein
MKSLFAKFFSIKQEPKKDILSLLDPSFLYEVKMLAMDRKNKVNMSTLESRHLNYLNSDLKNLYLESLQCKFLREVFHISPDLLLRREYREQVLNQTLPAYS